MKRQPEVKRKRDFGLSFCSCARFDILSTV